MITHQAPLDMDEVTIVPSCAFRIPGALALRKYVLPFYETQGKILVACLDPLDDGALRTVERHCGMPVTAEAAEKDSLLRAIHAIYGRGTRQQATTAAAAQPAEESVRRVDEMLNAAAVKDASDIHIEPAAHHVRIRFRVHGCLEDYQTISHAVYAGLLGRIKILSRLDIAEKRLPQDGQIDYTSPATGRTMTLRAATIATKFGERVTLRLLGQLSSSLTLKGLGMIAENLDHLSAALTKLSGMILITGPTGSGKTSTMYAALRHLLDHQKITPPNIITIEDPIEIVLPGISQIEVDEQRLTPAKALRSVLRHDPDVILIGEIRDRETAEIALRAAMTGHLVISTLHTRTATSAISRLLDLGVEPYLVASSVHLVIAQRLVRRLCPQCRTPFPLNRLATLGLGDTTLEGQTAWNANGCKYCAGSGFKGRLAIFELFEIDGEAATLIVTNSAESTYRDLQKRRGETTLRSDAITKVLSGAAAPDECARALSGVRD